MRTFVVNNINLGGLSQKWRMLRNRIYKNRIMFIHVPRSGGTSFSHAYIAYLSSNWIKRQAARPRLTYRADNGCHSSGAWRFTILQKKFIALMS